jgi:tetratricopeptide (TPR) repeat protein
MATDHFSDFVPAGAAATPPADVPAPAAQAVAVEEPPKPAPQAAAPPSPTPSHPAAAAPAKPKSRGMVEIDLTSALGDLQAAGAAPAPPPPPKNLDDVFKGMRKSALGTDSEDQAAQHMKLARTYIEMGMLEEATASLKTAARSPRQRFEAGTLLGRLYKEHGDIPHAIEWFERAAEAAAPSPEDGRALLYDLGVTLEEAGETARALGVFLELQADADDYRDVSERADRLARVQTGG